MCNKGSWRWTGTRKRFDLLKKGKRHPFNKLCQLSLETIHFEEVMTTFAGTYTKAMQFWTDTLFHHYILFPTIHFLIQQTMISNVSLLLIIFSPWWFHQSNFGISSSVWGCRGQAAENCFYEWNTWHCTAVAKTARVYRITWMGPKGYNTSVNRNLQSTCPLLFS